MRIYLLAGAWWSMVAGLQCCLCTPTAGSDHLLPPPAQLSNIVASTWRQDTDQFQPRATSQQPECWEIWQETRPLPTTQLFVENSFSELRHGNHSSDSIETRLFQSSIKITRSLRISCQTCQCWLLTAPCLQSCWLIMLVLLSHILLCGLYEAMKQGSEPEHQHHTLITVFYLQGHETGAGTRIPLHHDHTQPGQVPAAAAWWSLWWSSMASVSCGSDIAWAASAGVMQHWRQEFIDTCCCRV